MEAIIQLDYSTFSGYSLLINRITYLSKVGYNNKMKEYYFDIGYESSEFTKFTLSFNQESEAETERQRILKKINQYLTG